jgi:YHS domain-containing protein
MKYILIAIAVLFVVRYLFRKRKFLVRNVGEPLMRDPVCGTYVTRQKELSLRTPEETVYFCSPQCLKTFREQRR